VIANIESFNLAKLADKLAKIGKIGDLRRFHGQFVQFHGQFVQFRGQFVYF